MFYLVIVENSRLNAYQGGHTRTLARTLMCIANPLPSFVLTMYVPCNDVRMQMRLHVKNKKR